MKRNNFQGTMKLLKLYLRRDRFILPVWILLPMILLAGQVSFVGAMEDWREFITELSSSPLTQAYLGSIVPLSKEGAVLWRAMLQGSMAVMLGASLTTVRHTRTEETSGRTELIFGKSVGRYAGITAALILSCMGSLVAGLAGVAALIGGGFALDGALLAGFTLGLSGCLFAGIGSLFAQIFEHSGAAISSIFALYGFTMVPMVLNNIAGGRTLWAWFAPESWFRITEPFGGNYFWPLILFVLLSLVPMVVSIKLLENRDLGFGLLRQKDGKPNAKPGFSTPIALAWYQHKRGIMIWSLGMIFLGGSMGIAAPNISESISPLLTEISSWAATMQNLGNQEGFIAALIYILGLIAGLSVFAISGVLSLKEQEKEHYAELVLSRAVSRGRWMASYLAVVFIGSALILLSLGISTGLGWSIAAGDFSYLIRVLGMSLSKLPSVWMIVSVSAMLYGWVPRFSGILSWMILGIFILVEMMWEAGLVGLSVLKLTPFAYAHYTIPIEKVAIFPLIALILISILTVWVGIKGFSKRSIQ